ncbi:MAG: 16S rRNA (uracil(1498)-N(3))-methyltransferase [Gallionella sp.]|jgi:16S rRNA (uracil1498-N3)-methyltransferase
MPRFYCSSPIPDSDTFNLPADAAHHAGRVLRLRVGDEVQIFDGQGFEYHGAISDMSGKQVTLGNLVRVDVNKESTLRTLLAQALSGSEKMDWVIQKATELGVTEIQPVATERSVARLSAERAAKRTEHWQQVAISACEQCGRNVLPVIHAPLDISVWLQQMRASDVSKYILLPEGAASLHSQPRPEKTAALLIGAEGGFTQAESDSAQLCGFTPIRMGARVLRTETAAVAGLSAMQTLWGDFC